MDLQNEIARLKRIVYFLQRTGGGGGGGSGTVTSVAALTIGTTGTDLSSTVANSTTTPVITLQVPTASATNRGALSSTDWSTFNGKFTAVDASETVKGIAEIATQSETNTGTDDLRIVTPLKLANATNVVHTTGNETIGGVKTFSSAIIANSETASRIAIIDGSKNIKSADTSTYPSLTELSYLKGAYADMNDFIELSYTRSLTQMVW